jgi:hypothetical protein
MFEVGFEDTRFSSNLESNPGQRYYLQARALTLTWQWVDLLIASTNDYRALTLENVRNPAGAYGRGLTCERVMPLSISNVKCSQALVLL